MSLDLKSLGGLRGTLQEKIICSVLTGEEPVGTFSELTTPDDKLTARRYTCDKTYHPWFNRLGW
jgi:hypothetical protein